MISTKIISRILVLAVILFIYSCNSGKNHHYKDENKISTDKDFRRVGMVVKIDSTRLEEYLALHADSNPGVRDLLVKYHLRNFSIFLAKLDDGNYYEFGYYEYTGENYDADMAALDAEPRNKEWLKICDPMQIPFKGETSWKKMKKVYFNY